MVVFDLEGRMQRLNAAGRELVGLAEPEVAGTPLLDLVHPNDRGALGDRLAALRTGGSPRSGRACGCARRRVALLAGDAHHPGPRVAGPVHGGA
jgi:PAS domain S-box-containing protein